MSDTKIGNLTIDAAYMGNIQVDKLCLGNEVVWQHSSPTPVYSAMPLTIEFLESGTLNLVRGANASEVSVEVKINDGSWSQYTFTTAGTAISVSAGDKVAIRGNNPTYHESIAQDASSYSNMIRSTANHIMYGNIMSLVSATGYTTATTLQSAFTFSSMFLRDSGLTSVENIILPATNCILGCYLQLFRETPITKGPSILPATTLAERCYRLMFYGCTSLTTAPELPATTSAFGCYWETFTNCSSLSYIKCLLENPNTTDCNSWVKNVSSTGTFIKAPSATWTRGASAVPSNWTLVDAN